MFDFSFGEMLVVAVVALVVLGPERLPKAARFAGLWVRRARAQWHSVRDELERELAADELKRGLDAARQAMHDTEQSIRAGGEAVKQEFEQARDEIGDALSVKDGENTPSADAIPEAVADEAPLAPVQMEAQQAPAEDDPQADLFGSPGPRR